MIYTMDLTRGSQVINPGIPGAPSLWIRLDDPIGTFRVGYMDPDRRDLRVAVYYFGADDAWHQLEYLSRRDEGSWWVRHVSWTKVEVEYRN